MPNACVRHLGLLGYSESIRLSLSYPKCDSLHLADHPSPRRLLKCIRCLVAVRDSRQVSQRVATKSPKSGYALHKRYIKTKIFKMDALAQWTKDGWDFQLYRLNEGRVRAPKRYVNRRIKWRAIPNNAIPPTETVGYYTETSTSQRFHPIAFNCERCCWVELRWVSREDDAFWIAQRLAGDNLLCNIKTQDRRPIEEQGPLDRDDTQETTQAMATFASASRMVQIERIPTPPTHSPLRARTPTPSETSAEAQDEPTDEGAEPEQINVYSPEVEALVAQAESLHIPADEPMTTQTQTQTGGRQHQQTLDATIVLHSTTIVPECL